MLQVVNVLRAKTFIYLPQSIRKHLQSFCEYYLNISQYIITKTIITYTKNRKIPPQKLMAKKN